MGQAPVKDVARRNHREVVFAVGDCFGCRRRKDCPVKSVRNGYWFAYDKKQVKIARRRARERTASLRNRYRFRAGIEATFSALGRRTGVKHLRVRGLSAIRLAVVLKVLGLNLQRAAAVWCPENGGGPAPNGGIPRVLDGIALVNGKFTLLVGSVISYLASCLNPAQLALARAS